MIVIFGGIDESRRTLREVAVINVNNLAPNQYRKEPSFEWQIMYTTGMLGDNINRSDHTAHVFQNKMYVIGGLLHNQEVSDQILCLDLKNFEWKLCNLSGSKAEGRFYHSSVLYDGNIYIFGGCSNKRCTLEKDFFRFDIQSKKWQKITTNSATTPSARKGASMQVHENKFYLFGGSKGHLINTTYLNDLFVYDPVKNIWKEVLISSKISINRAFHSSFCYRDNLFICGGCIETGHSSNILSLSLGNEESKEKYMEESRDITEMAYSVQLKQLLLDQQYFDIVFEVEGQEFRAYKGLLAVRCKYFKNMFASGMMESEAKRIVVSDMKSSVFKALLEFIYCNDVELTPEAAKDLLLLADKYSFFDLKAKCEDFLQFTLNIDNLVEIAKVSCQVGSWRLKQSVMSLLKSTLNRNKVREKLHDLPKEFLAEFVLELFPAEYLQYDDEIL